jgi:hypothetical protein
MPDDLDDQLRAAMKTLDDETPSGYFEALPNQILARLEDGSMQNTGTTDIRDKRDALMGPPVAAVDTSSAKPRERDEDSGLHDIRNLAQSTKQRLSSRRGTQPPMSDDDVLASSSGSWKNIALPQPARMVALPELAELPSKAEVLAAEKKARKAKKTDSPADEVLAPVASANAAVAAMSAAPVAAIPERQAFSLPSQQGKRSKGPLLAVLGLGVAAAAGGLIFMQMTKESSPSQSAAGQTSDQAVAVRAEAAPPIVEPIAPEPSTVAAPAPEPTTEVAAVAAGDDDPSDTRASKKPTKPGATIGTGAAKKGADKEEDAPKVEKVVVEPKVEKADAKKPAAKGDESEPSFDALLKEAGVEDKKEAKPKLDKKSLSGEDFKKGMAAVAGKAQGCYKGTQGTAMVKLTVAPSGQVTKVSIGGAFAGTPEGACVEAAVKAASFPPWDGGPQSFTYSYMLAD